MRAAVYQGEREITIEERPDPTIDSPLDAIIQVTTTNICGSDLHMYEGRTNLAPGTVLGHENMGIVVEVGAGVERIQVGDRVSIPFNVACGSCNSCTRGWTSYCTRANPTDGVDGAVYGYANMGPYPGGQAEYLRVPWADFNALSLPPGEDHEQDFTMLSDVFPTGWHGVSLSGFEAGDTVAIYGAGPVGLMAAHSAVLRGGAEVFVVDKEPDRLSLAEAVGAHPVSYADGDPVQQVMDLTAGRGVDRGVEAVGYQAHDSRGEEQPALVLDNLASTVRSTGGIGVVGVYLPEDPGAADQQAQQGRIAEQFGQIFMNGQSFGTGQAPVKRYNETLRDLILAGRAHPGWIVSHQLSLDEAAHGYDQFDRRVEGWTKVLLKP